MIVFDGEMAVKVRRKWHEKKNIFETPYNEMRCVLSIKESNFNGKNRSKFSHLLKVRTEGADRPPLPHGHPDRK